MVWKPHVTVAAVIEDQGKYLFVHENSEGESVLNQPAGHLEENETLVDAVIREVQEETAYDFTPTHLLGIYLYRVPGAARSYLRFCFTGQLNGKCHTTLDPDIIETLWLTRDEMKYQPINLRSPMVNQSLDDYESGQRLPLDMLRSIP